MKCTSCNNEILEDSIFCEYCGSQIKKIKNHSNSGVKVALVIFIALSFVFGVTTSIGFHEKSLWIDRYYQAQDDAKTELQKIRNALKRPLIITKVEIGNEYKDGTIETAFGSKIYSSHSMFLAPRIEYVGVAQENITLYLRWYCPNGALSTGATSPKGYSMSTSLNVYTGDHIDYLSGWGGEKKGQWEKGKYKLEIWYDKSRIYKKEFFIY